MFGRKARKRGGIRIAGFHPFFSCIYTRKRPIQKKGHFLCVSPAITYNQDIISPNWRTQHNNGHTTNDEISVERTTFLINSLPHVYAIPKYTKPSSFPTVASIVLFPSVFLKRKTQKGLKNFLYLCIPCVICKRGMHLETSWWVFLRK